MGEMMQEVPSRVHQHVIPLRIQKKYNMKSYFYLDVWPIQDPLLYVLDPEIAQEITLHPALKHGIVRQFLTPLVGPSGDLVSSEGAVWKKWRGIMNPGFAQQHL